jgi:hypothetical protein
LLIITICGVCQSRSTHIRSGRSVDEDECPYGGYEKCPSASSDICIPRESFCDLFNNCGDNSDEENCESRVCLENELRCNSGQCINQVDYCHFGSYCEDGTPLYQQAACSEPECEENYERCPHQSRCIPRQDICDTISNCGGNTDEMNCESRVCNSDEVRCSTGQCIKLDDFCNSRASCRGRGESPTSVCLEYECAEGSSKCASDGRCVPNDKLCDTFQDCDDGSDELPHQCEVPVECPRRHVKCPTNRQCIPRRYMCDGEDDCGDNSDESPELCATRGRRKNRNVAEVF